MTKEALDPESIELNMLICIDAMAKRYSLLPSEVLERANTFDLVVLDSSIGYEQYVRNQAEGRIPEIKQEDVQRIWDEFNENKHRH